jgi:ketosteroid isomerase-like protein
MRRSFAILTLTSLCAMPVLADPPASLQSDFDAMVATERAFSKLSQEKGMKEAFATYIAEDGMLVRGGTFVQGKRWTLDHPNPPVKLIWWPTHAAISRSGDLGWTTGPYEIREDGSDEVGHGNFATVWKKQADGTWRFAVDLGNHYATPTGDKSTPTLNLETAQGPVPKADAAAEKAALLAADRELGQAAGKGTAPAFEARMADDGILLRGGAFPYMGKDAVRGGLEKEPAAMTSQPTGGGVSAAGDMGYTYGMAEWKKGDAKVMGNYMRIWEKRGGAWKVRMDVLNEAPPPPPPPAKQGS